MNFEKYNSSIILLGYLPILQERSVDAHNIKHGSVNSLHNVKSILSEFQTNKAQKPDISNFNFVLKMSK